MAHLYEKEMIKPHLRPRLCVEKGCFGAKERTYKLWSNHLFLADTLFSQSVRRMSLESDLPFLGPLQ